MILDCLQKWEHVSDGDERANIVRLPVVLPPLRPRPMFATFQTSNYHDFPNTPQEVGESSYSQ